MPVTTVHAEYRAAQGAWRRIRDVLAGEEAVKARCGVRTYPEQILPTPITPYIPRLDGHTDATYAAYVNRAVFYNASARTAAGLTGAVFRRDPEIQLSPRLEYLREQSDRTGTPLHLLAKAGFGEVLPMGRLGVLVDLPTDQVTAAPYLCVYTAEAITNWQVESIDNVPTLTLVVLKEMTTLPDPRDPYVDSVRTRYRVLELVNGRYRIRLVQHAVDAQGHERDDAFEPPTIITPLMREEPMTQIPFVFIGPMNLDAGVQRSPLMDLINLNLHHWRLSAERNNGLFVTSMPQAVVIGDQSIDTDTGRPMERRIGQGVAWELTAGASAQYLEFTGEGLGAIREELLDDEARMVLLGARLLEPQKRAAETAEALRLRQAGDSATLSMVADSVSWGLSLALGYAADWVGAEPERNFITLNQEFSETVMSEMEANLLVDRWQKGGATLDDVYALLKKGGRIESKVSEAEWKLKLETQQPLPPDLPPSQASPMDEGDQAA